MKNQIELNEFPKFKVPCYIIDSRWVCEINGVKHILHNTSGNLYRGKDENFNQIVVRKLDGKYYWHSYC